MIKKTAEKPPKKSQRSRLTHKEKLEVCRLLGSGHSRDEVSEIMTRKAKKPIGIWQVRHYLDSPKWAKFIRAARKDDVLHAEKISVFSTTGRVRKYNKLLTVFEKKFYGTLQNIEENIEVKSLNPLETMANIKILKMAASYMLKILREVREEEYEAIVKKGGSSEEQDELEDFFMLVERRVIASRRRRDPDRELERAAGLL